MNNPISDDDRAAVGVGSLPGDVVGVLVDVGAPPRLWAHLTLVHDVAVKLVAATHKAWPKLAFDAGAVVFGAAVHDVGKGVFVDELEAPGKLHEAEGERLLRARGVSEERARFCVTHGYSQDDPALVVEDLLVVAADTVWKGKRSSTLDDQVCACLVDDAGVARWQAFDRWDRILTALANDADRRLAWQGRFPVR